MHDGDSLSVDGAEVGVFEETDEVGLGGFLEGEKSGALESHLRLGVVSDLLDDSLERKLSDEKVGGFLVSSNLSESDGSRSVSVGLLESTGTTGGALAGGLGAQVLSGSLDA